MVKRMVLRCGQDIDQHQPDIGSLTRVVLMIVF